MLYGVERLIFQIYDIISLYLLISENYFFNKIDNS